MADKGNTDFIAAVTSELRAQREALMSVVSSLESTMADVAKAIESGKGVDMKPQLEAIESALADVAGGLGSDAAAKAIDRAVAAITKISPQINVTAPPVNVQVSPTPINVEAVMPQMPQQLPPVVHFHTPEQASTKWKIRIEGGWLPPRTATIERIAEKPKE